MEENLSTGRLEFLRDLAVQHPDNVNLEGKTVLALITRLEQAEARVKLLESGIVSELVVTSVNSARAIVTAVYDISEALLKLGYDGLTERLEQAEQDRVKLRNRLDAMRRQRDGYRNQLRKARTNQGENK